MILSIIAIARNCGHRYCVAGRKAPSVLEVNIKKLSLTNLIQKYICALLGYYAVSCDNCLPTYEYVHTTNGRLSRMLAKHKIKSVGLPSRKISSFLRPVKDDLGLRTPGVYSIPCECGWVYIGQTGRSIATRIKEHSRHIRLGHLEKWAVAEHRLTNDHRIRFQDTQLLSTKSGYMDRVIDWSATQTIRTGRMA
jgi:hypothetical protein